MAEEFTADIPPPEGQQQNRFKQFVEPSNRFSQFTQQQPPSQSPPSFWESMWQNAFGTEQKPTMAGAAGQGFGHAMGDPIYGGAQLGARMLASPGQGVPEQAGAPPGPDLTRQVDALARQREQAYLRSPAVRQHPLAAGAGRFGGDIAASVPLMMGGGGAATIPGRIGMGALQSGAGAAMAPATGGGDYWAEKRAQVMPAMAAGGILGGVGGALAGRLPMGPRTDATAAQGLGKAFPWVRNFMTGAEQRTVDGFDRTVARQVLDPIAGTVPAKFSGHELVKHTADQIDTAYERVLPGINLTESTFMRRSPELMQTVSELSDDLAGRYEKIMNNRVFSKFKDGVMDGNTFKQVQSYLTKRAYGYMGTNDQELGEALLDTAKHLNASVLKDSPEVARDLSRVNEAFMMFSRMREAAGGATAQGKFTPADLLRSSRRQDPSAGRERFASGEAALQAYGELGLRVLGQGGLQMSPMELAHMFTTGHRFLSGAARMTTRPAGRGLEAIAPYAAPVIGREIGGQEQDQPPDRLPRTGVAGG